MELNYKSMLAIGILKVCQVLLSITGVMMMNCDEDSDNFIVIETGFVSFSVCYGLQSKRRNGSHVLRTVTTATHNSLKERSPTLSQRGDATLIHDSILKICLAGILQ